ncbi:MAG: DNA polymerase III subunit delta [Bacteroidetes bacterium B1(2017)]|nr:MAG: DNA polymerase III subunit delta [Bacteroidetes bacterium B1(2017)]
MKVFLKIHSKVVSLAYLRNIEMPADSIQEYSKVISDLKARKFYPIYLLHGDEAYFIDEIVSHIENHVLTESERAFNQTVFYAKDIEISAVVENARRYPMMANHQVIIVKEAQGYKKLDDFEAYFDNPVPTTVLVIAVKGKKVDGRSKLYKSSKKYVSFESKRLYEDSELPRWIKQHLGERGLQISESNCLLIADHVGSDLSKVANELEKLLINKGDLTEVNEAMIEKHIGVSKDFNVFELMSALAHRNTKRTFYINHHMSSAKDFSIIPLLAQFNSFFMKGVVLKQTQVKDQKGMMSMGIGFRQIKDYEKMLSNFSMAELEKAMSLVAEYDLKSKGVNQTMVGDSELMKELLFKILYRPTLSN